MKKISKVCLKDVFLPRRSSRIANAFMLTFRRSEAIPVGQLSTEAVVVL